MESNTLIDLFEDNVGQFPPLPWHVVRRLAIFVPSPDDIVYLDYDLGEHDSLLSGSAVVITKTKIVQATLTDTPLRGTIAGEATVHVAAWARTRLARIALHAQAEGTGRNSDRVWADDYGDYWPHDASVTLHFTEGVDSLRLPLSQKPTKPQRTIFRQLVPDLANDLS